MKLRELIKRLEEMTDSYAISPEAEVVFSANQHDVFYSFINGVEPRILDDALIGIELFRFSE